MAELSQAFKRVFQNTLDMKKMKANEHLDRLMQCLRGHKLAYTVDHIPPEFVLAHAVNRGGGGFC
eukprot:8165746-Pyramimonas_sp.AAC.1